MEICNGSRKYSHDEIVFVRNCPCCALMDEKFDLENQIQKLNDEIDKLNSEE